MDKGTCQRPLILIWTKRCSVPGTPPDFELNPDSTVSVPQAPGLGVNVDRARLAAVTLRAETFRASN